MGRIAAVLCSAGCYVLLFPPFGASWLSWVSLVPLLLATRDRTPLQSAGLAGLWGVAMTAGIVAWLLPTLHDHFEFSSLAAVGFWLALSATAAAPFHAAAMAVCSRARSRMRVELTPLFVMATWVAAEYLRTQMGLQSPWALMGDSHYESARLRQIAELGGVYAVSAVVVLGNATIAEAIAIEWQRRKRRSVTPGQSARLWLIFASVCGASLGFGELRLGQLADYVNHVNYANDANTRSEKFGEKVEAEFEVAIIQGNLPPELRWKRSQAVRVLRRYSSLTQEVAKKTASDPTEPPLDLIVWPENAIQTTTADPILGPALRGLSRFGVPILFGAPHAEIVGGQTHHFNSAFLLRESGEVERYDKRRLLAFSETLPLGDWVAIRTEGDLDSQTYSRGNAPGVLSLPNATLGVLICVEALYPDLARDLAREGATLIVALSNDSWYQQTAGADQHLAQVVFRAIETRRPLIRAASGGISSIISSDGEIVARLDVDQRGILRGHVVLAPEAQTLYTQWGDAFAITCLVVCAAPLARRRRPTAE